MRGEIRSKRNIPQRRDLKLLPAYPANIIGLARVVSVVHREFKMGSLSNDWHARIVP